MIQSGDRILVCLSGGKDSLSLLHCMHAYQEACLRRSDYPSFEMGAVTVDPGSSAYDPRPLIPYLADLRVEYLYEEQSMSVICFLHITSRGSVGTLRGISQIHG